MHKFKQFALERKALFIRAAAILLPAAIALLLLSQTAFAQTTYVITDGDQVMIGGNDKYITLCRKCYRELVNNSNL